ncbi:hypothetical protein ACJJTC_018156 [Scirpophaga incertulas]
MGDLNIDIKIDSTDTRANEYLILQAAHGLLPAHTFTTRGSNCLDHVFLKSKMQSTTLVLESYITDHTPTVLLANISRKALKPLKSKIKVDYNAIHTTILSTDFSQILLSTDANFASDYLVSKISYIVKQHTKIYVISRTKLNIKPWITPGLLRCIKCRDRMHGQVKLNPDNLILKVTYTRYRNFINKLLKITKINYHKQMLQSAKNNSKNTWKAIKTITNMPPSISGAENLLDLHENKSIAVNLVNEHFVNVGSKLANKILNPGLLPCVGATPRESTSLALFDVEEQESLPLRRFVFLQLHSKCCPLPPLVSGSGGDVVLVVNLHLHKIGSVKVCSAPDLTVSDPVHKARGQQLLVVHIPRSSFQFRKDFDNTVDVDSDFRFDGCFFLDGFATSGTTARWD